MVTSPCYPTRCQEKGSKRTFNDLTGTLLDGSKRSVMDWILATFLLRLSCSSRRIARELGVHVRTGYRWRCWLRKASLSYEIGRQLEGTVAASKDHRWQLAESALMIGSNPRFRNPTRAPRINTMEPYFDLGSHSRPITTSSEEAQLWFNRGLNWLYGFNHAESVACFQRAAEFDPACAMAYWGIALARGPYINKQWSYYNLNSG